jgi:hypothetical protein
MEPSLSQVGVHHLHELAKVIGCVLIVIGIVIHLEDAEVRFHEEERFKPFSIECQPSGAIRVGSACEPDPCLAWSRVKRFEEEVAVITDHFRGHAQNRLFEVLPLLVCPHVLSVAETPGTKVADTAGTTHPLMGS